MPLLFYKLEGWNESTHDFRDAPDMRRKSKKMRARLSLNKDHRVFIRERLTYQDVVTAS